MADAYLSEADQLEAAADAPAQQSREAETQQLAAEGVAAATQREESGQQDPGDSSPLDAVCSGEAAVAVELAAVLRKWENSHRGAFCLRVCLFRFSCTWRMSSCAEGVGS